MGSTTLKSNPTIYNGPLNNMHKPQQRERSPTKAYATSDITTYDSGPRSPVSPLDSNGETWKYPPCARAHLKRLETLDEIPLHEVPKDHFRLRPMSYFDGLQTSPEPDGKSVFADLPPAPPKPRLSRPFDQPHPTTNDGPTPRPEKPSATPVHVPMQANMTRADSHLRRQPAESFSKRRAVAPASITIPPPAHQSRRQRDADPHRGHQLPAQASVRRQGGQAPAQRTARHRGWNPLEEPARQQCTTAQTRADLKDRRHDDDIEAQVGITSSKQRSRLSPPNDKAGRCCIFFFLILTVLIIVIIAIIIIVIENDTHKG